MSAKEILFARAARKSIGLGADALADVVKVTLGPGGRNVALEKSWGGPVVTKDGVTVAKEIELACRTENLGAQMLREVASRTNDDTGDGTTTATVLAQAIYAGGIKLVEAGHPAMELKRGIDAATAAVVAELQKMAVKVSGTDDIRRVATVSANGDERIGKILADAMEKVTRDGIVSVEEAKGLETEVEVVEGMQFDRGYLSPYFVTNTDTLSTELTDPYILVTDKKITAMMDLVPLLEATVKAGASLLVIAEDVEAEALAALVVNKLRGVLKVAACKAPGFGDRRKEMLKDIAVLTGATPIMEEAGRSFESLGLADLGRAKKVTLDKDNTTIIDGGGDKKAITGRIELIKKQVKDTTSDYDREKLEERLAKLAGGVAVIRVGAPTETEMKEMKFRVDDALQATRAAVAEGVVVGGGVALIRAARAIDALKLSDEQRVGALLIGRACAAPLEQIAANAGCEARVVVETVKSAQGNHGFNAYTEEYCDLVASGIIDPVKVVRIALQNASSIAGLMLTTECAIAELPKPEPAGMPGGDMGGMGGFDM